MLPSLQPSYNYGVGVGWWKKIRRRRWPQRRQRKKLFESFLFCVLNFWEFCEVRLGLNLSFEYGGDRHIGPQKSRRTAYHPPKNEDRRCGGWWEPEVWWKWKRVVVERYIRWEEEAGEMWRGRDWFGFFSTKMQQIWKWTHHNNHCFAPFLFFLLLEFRSIEIEFVLTFFFSNWLGIFLNSLIQASNSSKSCLNTWTNWSHTLKICEKLIQKSKLIESKHVLILTNWKFEKSFQKIPLKKSPKEESSSNYEMNAYQKDIKGIEGR